MKRYTKFAGGRGFTLIELLVVIAIIGILSSVVLVSLNSARSKGVNTRIQEDAANIRTGLETGYASGSYSDLSTSGTAGEDLYGTTNWGTAGTLGILRTDIEGTEKGKLYVYDSSCTSGVTCTGYKVEVAWPGLTTGGFCVDSNGNTQNYTTFTGTFTAGATCGTAL